MVRRVPGIFLIHLIFLVMAKVQNTLIGRASGSVGGATFTTWKGINILKSKPESVANPRTLGQVRQRNRLAVMVQVYRAIAFIIAIGFKSRAVAQSAYNAFMSSNIVGGTSVDVSGNASLNFANIKLALGTMGNTPFTVPAGSTTSNNVTFNWDANDTPLGGSPNDLGYAVLYDTNTNTWSSEQEVLRSAGTVQVQLDELPYGGSTIHCYLFFKAPNSDIVSDSAYTLMNIAND